LSSFSSYFKAMFSCELAESKQRQICFNDIDSLIMKSIIDYAYTSQLVIHENNVQSLLQASNLFDIKSIKDACCRYMEWHMDEFNVIGIHCFSEQYDCFNLRQISFSFILFNFCKVQKLFFNFTVLHRFQSLCQSIYFLVKICKPNNL
jgi:hypothetical protein